MKTRRCAQCRKKVPETDAIISSLKSFCSIEHLAEYAKTDRAKKYANKVVGKEKRIAKEKLKTRSDWQKDAQKAFNQYIRERDWGSDAGHYRSRGSAPHLAFHSHNCHRQCVRCNRYHNGNIVEYRKELITRIGIEKLEALEQDNRPRNYTINDFQRIIKICKRKIRRCQTR